ncbi:MAG: hypothetical protein K8R76_13100 [Candidatus Aegiribacteria sp.]|nr:hypothetical protein [Candidatus Aegiribacteria sp.]
MKFHRICITSSVVLIFFFTACFGPSADNSTWILTVGDDTVSVGQLGESWLGMDSLQRESFLSKDNTIGEFIVAYGRRVILEKELEAEGYLTDPLILSFKGSWLMVETAKAAKIMLVAREADEVTESDIQYYGEHLGRNVVYTVNPGSYNEYHVGPVHLPNLQREFAMHLDTLALHEMGTDESGLLVRLDTLIMVDSVLIKNALSNPVTVSDMAIRDLSNARFNRWAQSISSRIYTDYSVTVDTVKVIDFTQHLIGNNPDMSDDIVIVESDFGAWTVKNLEDEILFLDTRIDVQPGSSVWIEDMIQVLLMQCYFYEFMQEEAPEIVDSLRLESETYLLNFASEKYYNDMISSNVTVTESDIIYEYETLEEPVMIEEKRVLQAAYIPVERTDDFRQAVYSEELDEFISELDGFAYLVPDSTKPQITRPLRLGEVPGGHGEEVFSLDPSDTTSWLGPVSVFADDGSALLRLIEVVPPRVATIDEIKRSLKNMAMTRLQEQATVDLIHELEGKYILVINEDILDKLPSDPGMWTTF